MTWSYDPSDLATNEVDQIRLITGDTDQQAQLLQNEEIQFALDTQRNTWAAAAQCAENIGFLFTRRVDVKLGRAMQILYSKTAEQYFGLAKWLRAKSLASGGVVPYIGGAYVSDKLAIGNNSALAAPFFERNMMNNPWVGGYEPDSTAPLGNDPQPENSEDG